MKKIYLSALSLALATGLSAQVGNSQLAPKHSTFDSKVTTTYTPNLEKISIWTNNVSAVTDWAFANTSSPAQDWYRETNPASVPSDGPVAMTTASNGYLMIDSDGAGQTASQNATATYVGGMAINCTGYPAVTLEFEQHYRTFQDERYVEVSNDNWATFDTYTVTDGSEPGGTVVSGIGSIDISATAGNEANVSIRFRYIGNWGWHWAVDDLNVKTTEAYDLRADGTAWGVVGAWGARLPYFSTPTAQIQPIEFCGINTNIGLNAISDATYEVAIASASYASTGTVNSAVGATDTICATANFTPAGVGSFTATAEMTTTNPDTGTNNNEFADVTFAVSQFNYARDNSAVFVDGGTFNQGDGFEVGNVFDIFASADMTAIRIGINDAAEAGASIYAKLYTIDASTGDFVLQDQSLPYTVLAADLGDFVNLGLVGGPYTLTAGEPYLIVVGSDGDGGLTNDLVVNTSGDSEAQTSFYFDATDQTWYYTTSTVAVQMNFDPNVVLDETNDLSENANVFEMGVYPNPTNADANVSFSLNNTADVNITITDLSGKVVYANALGNVSAGTTEVSLNTSALSNGVYMINVAADNAVSTEKLIIRK